ncbi:MAG: radical SAM protein [Bacteroidales bacterium]|nr:radical SAM protein [Bacteroidales bacterium]
MEAYYAYLNGLVNNNKSIFQMYPQVNWINPYVHAELIDQRGQLLEKVGNSWLFKKTKPFHYQISKGCELCGKGLWSCLFITGKCNGACFYCPAAQNRDTTPTSQQLTFDTPEAYADYVNFFNFKGVSFSGGEPLLFFQRTLDYLLSVRKKCDPDIYTWLYTNGIVGDKEKYQMLADAGLNEIRFDIGATAYRLDKILSAKNLIRNITIEIPAIPEEKKLLMSLLPEMVKAGVTNLNLHQLRLTTYNAPKLLKRNYTYVPSERPVVLESEIAALEILNHAKNLELDLGVNYCAFDYKFRFQKAGYRKMVAGKFTGEGDYLTENGFLRKYSRDSLAYAGVLLSDNDHSQLLNSEKLYLNDKTYKVTRADSSAPMVINDLCRADVEQIFLEKSGTISGDETLFKIWQYEWIENGLRNWF